MTTLRKAQPFILALIAFLAFTHQGLAQTQNDCTAFTFTFTGDADQTGIQNLSSASSPCVNWRITFSTTGTLSTTVTFQTSPDNVTFTAVPNTLCSSSVQPPCVLQGANPTTGVQGMSYIAAYGAYVRVSTSASTGTGTGAVRGYGSKGATANAATSGGGGAPSGPAGGALAGTYPNPTFAAITTLGDTLAGISAGNPVNIPGNITGLTLCYTQTGTGSVSALPVWGPCPSAGSLTYYLQNSILLSGTYTSGGSITGTVGQTCVLNAFNGGGAGATATVALTGTNVIAGGTAITVTAAGTQYTSAPTSATLANGTATCSGTAVVATVLNVTSSSKAGDFRLLASPYSPKTTFSFPSLAAGTDTLQDWITDTGIPNLTFIPAGVFHVHLHALRSGAAGSVRLQAQLWEVSSAGVDIAQIGVTAAGPPLTTVELEFDIDFSTANVYPMASAASRIVMRLQAVVVGGSTPDLSFFVGGTADSRISLPSATVDATFFVPYTGATANLNLGAHTVSSGAAGGTGAYTVVGSTSGSATIQAAAAQGTPQPIQLPLATGTAGQALTTDGGTPQQLSWATTVASAYASVADGAPIAWNLAVKPAGSVTLDHTTATRALNVSNVVNGATYALIVKQDATGGALMTLGTGCTWKVVNGGAGVIVLTAAASGIDLLTFTYDGTNCYTLVQSNFN